MSNDKQIVKINEDTLAKIVKESTVKALNEGFFGDAITFAQEAKYYFKNHKMWIRKAEKIASALNGLLSYLDENGEDEDCENIAKAISLVESVIKNLEEYHRQDKENQ